MSSIRIPTLPNSGNKYLNVKIEQDFDFIEILSLNITQDKAYENFCSDYGAIVGRVIINNGFGVPNAKVSVFIPISDADKQDPQIFGLYPFTTITDTDSNGVRYNLLPKEADNQDACYTPVGTFPTKREVLDNNDMLQIYCQYYKYTTTTNYAGDFMLFGVPLGNYTVHVDVDISNIGIATQKPYDLIDQGTPSKMFYSPTKYKSSTNLNSLIQIKSANATVNVQPFWGDTNNCSVGINRLDFDLNYTIRPAAIFMGSIFGDSHKNSVNKDCRPRKKLGLMCEQTTREGTIEMIRKTIDNQIEQFDVDGGRVIDTNGTWAYQIPMNLDYVITNEFGDLVPTNDPSKGIPTRASVRFRIGMDEDGGIGRIRTRGKYLVPHNPQHTSDLDYSFDETTKDNSFVDLYWNKIYTVKNFIARQERVDATKKSKDYIGIKDVDGCVGDKTPFPYNRTYTKGNPLFTIICILVTIIAYIVSPLNAFLCWLSSIRIFGHHIFGGVHPIALTCPSDPSQTFHPGCNGESPNDFIKCISGVLAEDLNMFQFDFYNDWVNGTLYYYLLKYKKKRRGTEKFCETYCGENQGTGDNPCRSSEITDTTYLSNSDERSIQFNNGLLVKYDNNLYYPPLVLDNDNIRLFPTDIVSLGSVFDCDWQGFPKIIEYLTSTSYNIPPLFAEVDPDSKDTVSGIVKESGGDYLFYDIDCGGITFTSNNSTNIRRLCELSVDLPESLSGSTTRTTVSINEIYDVTSSADTLTSTNRFVRDSFTLLNISGASINSYPPTNNILPILDANLGSSFAINGSPTTEDHTNGILYNTFRNSINTYDLSKPDMGFQALGGSYYMYFGIIPGSTALDKLNSKYFVPCVATMLDNFIIEANVTATTSNISTDGSISFTFVGGTSPFVYTITNNIMPEVGPLTGTTGQLTNLGVGTYTITATDMIGTTMTTEVTIDGPQTLTCNYSVVQNATTTTSTDGQVDLVLVGGITPYTLTYVNNTTNITYPSIANISSRIITGLAAGEYTFTITDSSTTPEVCSQTITIASPAQLAVTVPNSSDGYQNVSCGETNDAYIYPAISGGVPPYSVRITGPNGYDQTMDYITEDFNSLYSGLYTITATDSNGQTQTITFSIIQSTPPTLLASIVSNVVTYTGLGGTPPYTFSPVDIGSSNTYTGLIGDTYNATITDNAGCTSTITITI